MKLYYMPEFITPDAQDSFVSDENGNVIFKIVKDRAGAGFKAHIMDADNKEVAYIHQKLMALSLKFIVEVSGREFTFQLKHKLNGACRFETGDKSWRSDGDLRDHEYDIVAADGAVFHVREVSPKDEALSNIYEKIAAVYHNMTQGVREISSASEKNAAEVIAVAVACEAAVSLDQANLS